MSTEKLGVHSEAGKLRKVLVCSPGLAHQRLTPNNCDELVRRCDLGQPGQARPLRLRQQDA
jgi:hypothetical protein